MTKSTGSTILSITLILVLLAGCNSEKKEHDKIAYGELPYTTVNTTIRAISYNIHHCNPPSLKDTIDLDAIVKTIEAQKADIVALQEVDVNTARSGKGNQAEMIAKKLNMHYFFAKAIDFGGGAYGVAILSKFPLLETTIHKLPTKGNEEDRVLATAKIEIAPGTHILFGNTHLNSSKSSENRVLQMKEIVNITNEVKDMDIIIAGDFNAVPESDVIKIAEANFTNTCIDCKPTFPATKPTRIIDYLVYKANNTNITIKRADVIEDSTSSDHRPVLADINFSK
ncbi:endonuclease/exonuclease/phosphatase family protein [Arenibacter certesii]|uniref:Endonuclease/exonuclease/phosphatase domain-containing protein n=1 Tax=Arenibacter certesii TaxID=228955 RepID=A0A918MH23_9FLAO|nr:endonuclease/exonuclease/phosphatase family protein [Arenibacter certesii]GGW24766.1 hypothetical protein GCM10007383_06790 [Arenibacter certesii]